MVTIEDVLEEIVGEIADEHDDAVADDFKQLDETTYETYGRTHIADVNERLGIQLPDEESFDTLGGFVFHELGRIPAVGESFKRGRVRIKILDANRRRIDRLQIELLPEVSPTDPESTPAEAKPNGEDAGSVEQGGS
ncbi:MAG: transporter associated domain-containing protein [Pirellulales bacterium]